jgi:hypothetical protein
MTDDWRYFPCSMGDNTAFIFVDVGIAKTIANEPSKLVKVRLTYKNPGENGLPTSAEFEGARSIEDALEKFANERSSRYVGRVTVAGCRHFYVYSSADETEWKTFVDALSVSTGYEFATAVREDPQHESYWQDLYPTDDDWQVIHDLGVLDALHKEGDDGTTPRQIDHWIYFATEEAAVPFLAWAEQEGFTHDKAHSHEAKDGKHCVRLYHNGPATLKAISARTIALRRNAATHGGEYDGWEAPVLRRQG